uniref:Uncharacterized protein n=1 Tax=Panagrellus redivivus TaxID=6233 RepID=A0A7E4VJ61_PANRE
MFQGLFDEIPPLGSPMDTGRSDSSTVVNAAPRRLTCLLDLSVRCVGIVVVNNEFSNDPETIDPTVTATFHQLD